MPENAPDQTDQPSTPETATADSGEATTSTPADAAATGFRFQAGDGVPDWAVGKTSKEVLQTAQQLYNYVQKGQPPQQPQAAAPQPAPEPTAPQMPTEDEWLNSPTQAAAKYAEYMQQTTLGPRFSQFSASLGQMARETVRQTEADAFRRWGPEIDLMISNIAPENRTVESIQMVVKMVKAQHLDEIAEQKAKERLDKLMESQGLRADGSGAPPTGTVADRLNFDKANLPPEYRRVLARHNVTPETLDEFLEATEVRKRGITLQQARDEWLKKATKGDIVTEEAMRIG